MGKRKKDEVVHSEPLTYKQKIARARQLANDPDSGLCFASEIPPITYISSGIEAFDRLTGSYSSGPNPQYLGSGGVPRGRYTIVWGPQGVGKSTDIYRLIANAQQQNLVCLLVDAENRATEPWMKVQGIDTSTLLWHRGGVLEQTLQKLIDMLMVVDLAIIDTVHALAPKADLQDGKGIKKKMEDEAQLGRTAFGLGKFFRAATHRVATAGVSVVLVGQARDAINATYPMKQLVGGNALMHYATHILKISKISGAEKLEGASVPKKKVMSPSGSIIEVPSGFLQKITLEKTGTNHLEGQSIEIPFLYGLGPDDFKSNILAAIAAGIIGVTGPGRYEVPTRDGTVSLHGKNKLFEFFQKDTSFYEWLMQSVTKTEEESNEDKTQKD